MNRSYSKKRHINLVNEALEQAYLEKNSNKKILNEVGYYNNWIDVDFQNGTLKLNKYLDMENDSDAYGGDELQLQPGTLFKKKGNELIGTGLSVKIVGDYSGAVKDAFHNVKVKYNCSSRRAQMWTMKYWHGDFYGENWASETQKGFDDLCSADVEYKEPEKVCGKEPKKYEMCYTAEDILDDGAILYPGYFCNKENNAIIMLQDALEMAGQEVDEAGYYGLKTLKAVAAVLKIDLCNQKGNKFGSEADIPIGKNSWGKLGLGRTIVITGNTEVITGDTTTKKEGGGGGGGTKWRDCSDGIYYWSCKADAVREAQICLKEQGLYTRKIDGLFGDGTLRAIKKKLNKDTFTDDDLKNLICKSGGGGGDENNQNNQNNQNTKERTDDYDIV